MAGFLKGLQKKSGSDGGPPREPLAPKPGSRASPETVVTTTDQCLGDPTKLLDELKAESQMIARESQSADAPKDPNYAAYQTRNKIKLVGRERKKTGKFAKSAMADSKLPWWIDGFIPASPQVNLLVPKAREALNEILTEKTSKEELPIAIRKAVNIAAAQLASEVRLSSKDIEDAVVDLASLMSGKGPLQPLYDDVAVTDIYMDGHNSIKCLRRGYALKCPFKFRSPDEYEAAINAMLQSVDRVLNLSSPIVDAVLEDGYRSRISAVHHSLLDGDESGIVIRIPRLQQIEFPDLLETHTLPPSLADWLSGLVEDGEANILVMGPTGSGKTVLTTALLSAVGENERICTIEDVPEIFVPTAHLEKLVARPENAQGRGFVGLDQLLRAALRRAPHRIVVGEIRDKEASLFLKALETGHMGSVATIHAMNPKEGLWRLLDLVAANESSPESSIQRRISRSVNIMISMARVNGRPCLMDVSEVHTPINGEFIVRQLVKFEEEDSQGQRTWRAMCAQSIWIDKLREKGIDLMLGPGLLAPEVKGAPLVTQ